MAKKKKATANPFDGKIIRNMIFFVGICFIAYLFLQKNSPTGSKTPLTEKMILQRTHDNYFHDVDSIAKRLELPTSYLMAVIVLECSGRKNFEPRYEQHVYQKLKNARDNNKRFGSITKDIIHDASDGALKNLATSWGPFQLMGYQCIELEVLVNDIRGEHSIYWGAYWMKKRYGKLLKKGKFNHCFHIHNTGQKIPISGKHKTHDPNYVSNGMGYMRHFEKLMAKNETLEVR